MKCKGWSFIRIAGPAFFAAAVFTSPSVAQTLTPTHHDCSGSPAHAQEIACGETIDDELTSAGSCRVSTNGPYFDIYSFDGTPGQQITVTMTGGFDTHLSLCFSISCLAVGGERGGPTSSQIVFTLPWGGRWLVLASAWEANTFGAYTLTVQCSGGGGPCEPEPTTLCLQNGRYRVNAVFRTPDGQTGDAMAVPLTSDTGLFWFFSANNIELIVKVLDGCVVNQHHWVFAAGLTNVDVTLWVIDIQSGTYRVYTNQQGRAFEPIQDTSAFDNCS